MDNQAKLHTVLFGFLFSLVMGLFAATVYADYQSGKGFDALADLNYLALVYETPFYRGHLAPVFVDGLMITAAVVFVGTMVTAVIGMRQRQDHGTARWARFGESGLAGYLPRYSKVTGPIFGKTRGPGAFGKYLTNGDQPHSLVVAPTRAGKGVGVVIPTLLTFNGSVLALDVKGELFELTSPSRLARGDRGFKFAPFDPLRRTHSYNPVLDIVHMPEERRFSETRRLAYNLIAAKGKGSEGFIDGARDLVYGRRPRLNRARHTHHRRGLLPVLPAGREIQALAQLAEHTRNV